MKNVSWEGAVQKEWTSKEGRRTHEGQGRSMRKEQSREPVNKDEDRPGDSSV